MNAENKMTWIESLRGIAAFSVFVSHLRFIGGSQVGFVIGRIGVVLFFLMSGYLALGSRKRKTKKTISLQSPLPYVSGILGVIVTDIFVRTFFR